MVAEAVRMQPHSVEAEQAVLGALLLDASAWPLIQTTLRADDFYRADHRLIFAAIEDVAARGHAGDLVTVSECLERTQRLEDAGGLAYLGTLARDTPSAANIEAYAQVVRERAGLRRLHACARQIARSVHDVGERSVAELISGAEQALAELRGNARAGRGLVATRELMREFVDDLEKRTVEQRGLSIGLADFDVLTTGLEPGDLVVIAGRPGLGKTSLLISIAASVSERVPVAVFSAEMPAQQLMRRAVALLASVPQGKLRRADTLDDAEWKSVWPAVDAVVARSLFVDDTAAPTLAHVRAELIGMRARSGLGLVVVDYVQLMRGIGATRYEQLREIAYGLKGLAKELSVPVIALAQLNRAVESREAKRPVVSDLRDSGAIEEAADIVAMLYSQGYYDADFGMPYVLECNVEKARNGERGRCWWRFTGAYSRVEVLDDGARAHYRQLCAKAERRGPATDL